MKQRNGKKNGRLITIGYEGKLPKDIFAALICCGTDVLCDVRKNAISRKQGFSKKALSSACVQLNIEYRHLPAFGIDSSLRKALSTSGEYAELFATYKRTVLMETTVQQQSLLAELKSGKSIALLCFEKDPAMCHRSRLVDALVEKSGKKIIVYHL